MNAVLKKQMPPSPPQKLRFCKVPRSGTLPNTPSCYSTHRLRSPDHAHRYAPLRSRRSPAPERRVVAGPIVEQNREVLQGAASAAHSYVKRP